jgi:hypothetical protein
MNIELTEEQRHAIRVGEMPIRVVDPESKITYVRVRADLYERLQELLGGEWQPREAYPGIDRAFSEGWNDPKMADYDRYEEWKQ